MPSADISVRDEELINIKLFTLSTRTVENIRHVELLLTKTPLILSSIHDLGAVRRFRCFLRPR